LILLAVGAIAGGFLSHHWMSDMVLASSANPQLTHAAEHAQEHAVHPTLLGMDIHKAVMVLSIIGALAGISLAAYFHLLRRDAAGKVKASYASLCDLLENKYFIDELYDAAIVRPLKLMGSLCFVIDRLVIDGVVAVVGLVPRLMGITARHSQTGVLQGYGLGMVIGLAGILLMVIFMIQN